MLPEFTIYSLVFKGVFLEADYKVDSLGFVSVFDLVDGSFTVIA